MCSIRGNISRKMTTLPKWRLHALIAVSVVAGASCNEAGHDGGQDPDGATSSAAPNAVGQSPLRTPFLARELSSGHCQRAVRLIVELEQLRLEFPENHPSVHSLEEKVAAAQAQCTAGTGSNRLIRNGEQLCDGYLVRRIDQNYCADKVPEDWVRREFNGRAYHFQPLRAPEPALATHR
jgi:hypothetical protein